MLYLVIALIVLGIVAAATELASRKNNSDATIVVPAGDCASCDGTSTQCEQMCTMEAATKPIEYFDDEELDAYKGRPSDSYNDAETEQFANILETLGDDEVAAWGRSLTLRGINMPDGIKDEFILLAQHSS